MITRALAHEEIIVALALFALAACSARRPFDVIAHRGASGHAPEHTFAAWDLALEMGADYIEQDLQMTRDGVLVVLHDDTLDRTARGPAGDCAGAVRDKTYAQLRNCEVSSWWWKASGTSAADAVPERIPTLDEVLARYGNTTRYYIETKQPEEAPGMEEALLRALAAHDLLPASRDDRGVLVQSFSRASLEKIHALAGTVPLVQLIGEEQIPEDPDSVLGEIAAYAVGIGPAWRGVTPELVAAAHRHGLLVHPYTVDEPAEMRRLVDIGVDGIFTNFPDRLVRILSRGGALGGD